MKSKQLTNKGYQNYVKAYKKKVNTLLKKDLFSGSKLLSRIAWEETYKATRNTLVADVKSGARKTVGNVNQYIIAKQVYSVSTKQAKLFQKAAEATGRKYTIAEIRSGNVDMGPNSPIWTEIKEQYTRGKALGLNAEEIAFEIGWFYFGSE